MNTELMQEVFKKRVRDALSPFVGVQVTPEVIDKIKHTLDGLINKIRDEGWLEQAEFKPGGLLFCPDDGDIQFHFVFEPKNSAQDN